MSARATVRTAASSRLMRLVCLSATLGALALALGAGAATAASQEDGYIPMADGTQLEYTVDLPAGSGRFQVAMVYDGYCEGAGATVAATTVPNATALLASGYAVLGVSIRGTSCSTGTFDAFTPQEWRDGAAAVEWASRAVVVDRARSACWATRSRASRRSAWRVCARGAWSRSRRSRWSPTCIATAASPGGIQNTGFGAFWAGVDQPNNSYRSGLQTGGQRRGRRVPPGHR